MLVREVGGGRYPFSTKDAIRHLVVFIPVAGVLRGLYFFPESVLRERGYWESDRETGRMSLVVHPPFGKQSQNAMTRRSQKWQNEFFICLADSSSLQVARAKLRQLMCQSADLFSCSQSNTTAKLSDVSSFGD